ncbi:MAG: PhoD-like phosphatase [Oscillatoria sp. Prado101]|jgi:hypothetical protein|nr:PhoD-like phosphatase [Oscillatoria sp. Prado101]
MTWTPLNQRIASLPLILAGPILRRTEPDSVTVWVALKESREVTLRVHATSNNGETVSNVLLSGTRTTVRLGKYLHVVAVTAVPVSGNRLAPAQMCAYDLDFGGVNLAGALTSAGFPNASISYFQHGLPTFAMPPADLNDLRIVHGSCRKPHGGGSDGLAILDDLIEYSAKQPNSRPHQLFVSGDQIYGDDVADVLLQALTDAGDTLLGWEEKLPVAKTTAGFEYKHPIDIVPGSRSPIAENYAGLTAMLINKWDKAKSHLLSLGEYFAMYMFTWSPVLWPNDLPEAGTNTQQEPALAKLWNEEFTAIHDFAGDVWKVRRSLANVPTYTIFDDHDISDDWYMNREWCERVLSKPLGRRVVLNGLLAYATFQAWGNTPEQFQNGRNGEKLLKAAKTWSESGGNDEPVLEEIVKYLGIPPTEPGTGLPKLKTDGNVLILDRDCPDGTKPITWHYTVRSFKHEVIVLDTRTWRGYPQGKGKALAPPMLLSPTGFERQIQLPLSQKSSANIEVTMVVVPTNLVSLSLIDIVQRWTMITGNVFHSDVGDSWNLNEAGFSRLLAEIFKQRERVVVLSGDIHYASTVRLSYWFRRHFGDAKSGANTPLQPRVLAQLTASAFKNAELLTQIAQTKVKSAAQEDVQNWAGWNEPPQVMEIAKTADKVRALHVNVPQNGPVLLQTNGTRGNGQTVWEIAAKDSNSLPDWRYNIEWVNREPSVAAGWQKKPVSPVPPPTLSLDKFGNSPAMKLLGGVVSVLMQNQWVQEGSEVVGHSNLGVVSFNWSQNDDAKTVIQDIYWRAPWEPGSTVYSRYSVPLRLDSPPPPLKVIS